MRRATLQRTTGAPEDRMNGNGRLLLDRALESAKVSAYPPGEFVGQESFMRAGEILALADRAGVGPGVTVLDLCCGVAGPGRFVTARLGCSYTGVDASPEALDIARQRAAGLPCRFLAATIPPVPAGPVDVVLLLETMLAFSDKRTLLDGVASALSAGGRFAFTFEEGRPLTEAEERIMPDAGTVRLLPLPDMLVGLEDAGFRVRWLRECSRSHAEIAAALVDFFTAERGHIAAAIGFPAVDGLLTAHRLWSQWLGDGRVRKFAVVAEKRGRA